MLPDVGLLKLLTLAVIAVLVFGPDRLPEFVRQVAAFLHGVRRFTDGAQQEVRSQLGPGYEDFTFSDLHPRELARKHLLDGQTPAEAVRETFGPQAEWTETADAVRGAVRTGAPVRPRPAAPAAAGVEDGAARPVFDPDTT
ncbi:Sec-independent protein translocase subunit TatB [Streptomyces sp. ODS05-4]|uniref:Sec-independent protein translocase subunit TatB n=1 Tax=Streptomyces sp. ODS05-4 TaxID=2944939 RepID=UPI00210D7069|nr:Sec-independent protein translocase subunit TatB [Streptomyces sp. ODS05-4]